MKEPIKQKDQVEFPSRSVKLVTGCGNLYAHLMYEDEDRTKLYGLHTTFGKAGGCACTQLKSKTAFINALIRNTSHSIAISTLTEARGHRCHEGDTCHDLLIQLVIEELMKIKI
jgi:hypothetical protein